MSEVQRTYTYKFSKERFQPQENWMVDNLIGEFIMDSRAYGCNTENSDYDILALVMDQEKMLNPQKYGFILGYDNVPRFENKELKGEHKRITLDNDKTAEAAWHSLTNFFHLVSKGSPALTEILFVRSNLITYRTQISDLLRDNRKLFLSMNMFYSFKGYCFQQYKRIKAGVVEWNNKHTCDNKTRKESYEKFGFDVKMSYHLL